MEIGNLLNKIQGIQLELAENTPRGFRRYLYPQLARDNRLNILVGARGVGKTTLLLQKFRKLLLESEKALYFSADSAYLAPYSLLEIGEHFYKRGGRYLVVDEAQHYSNWQQEIKTLYDSYPKLKLTVTGSSSLRLTMEQFDLSRRSRVYRLPGMSFREFVGLYRGLSLETVNLDALFKNPGRLALAVKRELGAHQLQVLSLFQDYLQFGYYPYFVEDRKGFTERLENAVEKVLYEDIPVLSSIGADKVKLLKNILTLVATSSPFKVNIQRLGSSLGVSRPTVYSYLDMLERAQLILGLRQGLGGYSATRKPKKLYLGNPNLYPVLAGATVDASLVGAVRETFFANQVSQVADLAVDKRYDFVVSSMVGEDRRVEVGGENKSVPDSDVWIAKDGVEIGGSQTIPLYLFGFLY